MIQKPGLEVSPSARNLCARPSLNLALDWGVGRMAAVLLNSTRFRSGISFR